MCVFMLLSLLLPLLFYEYSKPSSSLSAASRSSTLLSPDDDDCESLLSEDAAVALYALMKDVLANTTSSFRKEIR